MLGIEAHPQTAPFPNGRRNEAKLAVAMKGGLRVKSHVYISTSLVLQGQTLSYFISVSL